MRQSSLRLDMHDIVRRAITAKIHSTFGLHPTVDKPFREFLPEYYIQLPRGYFGRNVRALAALSTKQHGKKRVYTDLSTDAEKPIHLYYVSKRDLIRIVGEVPEGGLVSRFANKWHVTIGKPIHACKNFGQWVRSIVCVERTSSRANHPPSGNTGMNGVWELGPYVDRMLSEHCALDEEILCTVTRRVH